MARSNNPKIEISWVPRVQVDIDSIKDGKFYQEVEKFYEEAKAIPESELPSISDLTLGWHVITPQRAEELLLRNRANRRLSLATIKYYANQMRAGEWRKTGQGIILDEAKKLIDSQHRLWASLLSGISFVTLVVPDVPNPDGNLFAFLDNGKVRSPTDALQTAKYNGLAPVLVMAIKHSLAVDHGKYTASRKLSMPKLPPIHYISFVDQNPNLLKAARLMAGEYSSAKKVIQHHDVAAYMAFQILELFDEVVLDEFMSDMGAEEAHVESQAVRAFQALMERDSVQKEPHLKKFQVLGCLIKTFNFWRRDEVVKDWKKVVMRVNESWPHVALPDEEDLEAA
jgi:hypothetical protein